MGPLPGSDGKTVFVTQRQGGFVESFRADRPGRNVLRRAPRQARNRNRSPLAKNFRGADDLREEADQACFKRRTSNP
jgi:hypothetical protein